MEDKASLRSLEMHCESQPSSLYTKCLEVWTAQLYSQYLQDFPQAVHPLGVVFKSRGSVTFPSPFCPTDTMDCCVCSTDTAASRNGQQGSAAKLNFWQQYPATWIPAKARELFWISLHSMLLLPPFLLRLLSGFFTFRQLFYKFTSILRKRIPFIKVLLTVLISWVVLKP